MKPWLVTDNGNGITEEFETEDDALAFAAETLDTYREEAFADGEWSYEVDYVGVYRLTHSAQISKTEIDEDDGTESNDYEITPVSLSTDAVIWRLRAEAMLNVADYEMRKQILEGQWP